MYVEHSEFEIDRTHNLPLWRYMDFWKFLKLISSSELFFPNVEMLGDQHEGRIPSKIFEFMKARELKKSGNTKSVDNYKNVIEDLRSKTLISSWVANEKESFAMWKIYSKDKLGVAIKTDFKNLKKSFDSATEQIYIGEIRYYSEEAPFYKTGNTFYSFLMKQDYYEFESEVRCITEILDGETCTFKNIKVDLNHLIKEVYISPFTTGTDITHILELLKNKYSLTFDINTSGVNDKWI